MADPEIKTFKLTIEYDGSAYHGWQCQKNIPTIQAAIETALATMTGQHARIRGSGRTDAGVHARGQVASFECCTRLDAEAFQHGLNSLLPPDIVICDCRLVDNRFHAQYDAQSKRYRYRIVNQPLPLAIGRQYVWWIRRPLDLDAMQQACACLAGRHDFKAFEGSGSPRRHSLRTIYEAELTRGRHNRIEFYIRGSGFLKFMVRNIVGTLVEIGLGKYPATECQSILNSRDRGRAGQTAPACGLCLLEVFY